MLALLMLPEEYVQYVFSVWLRLPNIAKLDSAFCNRVNRPRFLKVAYSSTITYNQDWQDLPAIRSLSSELILSWIELREVVVSSLLVGTNIPIAVFNSILHRCGPKVKQIQSLANCEYEFTAHYAELVLTLCENLEELSLGNVGWSCPTLKKLVQYSSIGIQRIYFGIYEVMIDEFVSILQKLPMLTHLQFAWCSHRGTLNKASEYLCSIRYLDVTASNDATMCLADNDVLALARHCPLLETFYGPCEELTDATLLALVDGCPNLRSLQFSTWYTASTAAVAAAIEKLKNLREVTLGMYHDIVPVLTALVRYLPHLDKLHIERWVPLDLALHLLSELRRLTALSVLDCHRVEDCEVAAVQHLPLLRTLDLAKSGFGDVTIMAAALHCPLLKDVNLCQTNVTDAGVLALAEKAKDLRVLNVANRCVTEKALQQLPLHCRHLQHLTISREVQRIYWGENGTPIKGLARVFPRRWAVRAADAEHYDDMGGVEGGMDVFDGGGNYGDY